MMRSFLQPLAALLLLTCSAPLLPAADEEEPKKEPEHKDFRVFTAKNGKTVEARVVARIDDERYTVESKDGKSFTLKIDTLSDSDQQFLEFWEPGAILDLATATLKQVLEKMNYSAAELVTTGDLQIVTAKVGDSEMKFVLAPNRNFSGLDPAAATELGLTLSEGTIDMRDAQGNTERTKQGTVKTFAIGEVELKSLEFQVFDLAKLVGSAPAQTAGILGMDLLQKLNAVIDLGGSFLYVREGK